MLDRLLRDRLPQEEENFYQNLLARIQRYMDLEDSPKKEEVKKEIQAFFKTHKQGNNDNLAKYNKINFSIPDLGVHLVSLGLNF